MRWFKRIAVGCGVLVLVLGVALLGFARSRTGRTTIAAVEQVLATDELHGAHLATAEEMAGYLAAHPDRYALAAFDVGDEDGGVFHDATTPWPLASTVKLIPLALVSERLSTGQLEAQAPLPEVDALYLPGTDGDAHPQATRGLDGGVHTIGAALRAMIRYSDNAATDALLLRLGRADLDAQVPRLIDGPGLPVPHPLNGTTLLARDGFDGGARAELDDAAWATATRLVNDAAFRQGVTTSLEQDGIGLDVPAQESMARRLDNRGTPLGFARLIEELCTDDSPRTAAARAQLAWPMEFPSNRAEFNRFETKGGSMPSVLTSASFAESKSGRRRVVALFLHDLPFATWATLANSYAQQALEREVLRREDGLAWLRARLEVRRDGGPR